MPIVAVSPSAFRTSSTYKFARGVSEGVFKFVVDGRMVEATFAVRAVVAEVMFIAEFATADVVFEAPLFLG